MYICIGLVLNLPPENKPWNVVGNFKANHMEIVQEKIKILKNIKQYFFYPPENIKVVEEFEKYHKLELPLFYKKFITQISNGIEIKKDLDYLDEDILIRFDFNSRDDVNDINCSLHKEFPLEKAEMEFSNTDFEYCDILNGTIQIKSTGCGNGILLIVKGKCKGQIWVDEIMSNGEIYPLNKNSCFEDWINNEIDRKIKNKKNDDFLTKFYNIFK